MNNLEKQYEDIKESNMFKSQEEKIERWGEKVDRHSLRSEFQRDRDRILYSRAFRRLSGKTQVFRTGNDDHIRTRLTHTLEVSQIARTISKELGLDEDLTEAIALGHDLGHTPFGHVGERTLNQIMNGCYIIGDFNTDLMKSNIKKGFKHNLQGVRVVNEIEESPLNLTKETIFGIMHHSSMSYKECNKDGFSNCDLKHKNKNSEDCGKQYKLDFYEYITDKIKYDQFWSLEALVVAMADEIAQRHHDIEDAIEFKIISQENLSNTINDCFGELIEEGSSHYNTLRKLSDEVDKYEMISNFSKFIVDFLTTDLINESKKNIITMKEKFNISSTEDFYTKKSSIYNDVDTFANEKDKNYIFNVIKFSDDTKKGDKKLQKFLKNRILKSFEAQRMDGLGSYVITKLFEAYTHNPQQLSDKAIKRLYKNIYDNKVGLESKLKELKKDTPIEELDKYTKIINDIKELSEDIKDTADVGEIRDVIGRLHYQVMDGKLEVDEIYKDILLRTICDYIGGMTDSYALNEHKALYNHN
ncbi:MAG: deoxyguanosinetriphosphate triphosphohydrolase family protein [Paraclostridium sp.]